MPTYTTIPFLALLVLMWRWTRGNTVAIVAFMSIFDAASVFNIGTLGIPPWLMTLAICMPIQVLQGRVGFHVAAGTVNRLGLKLLLAFLIFASLSGIALPIVFQGIPVIQLMEQVPLQWGLPNVAQLCYLAAACAVLLLTITSTPEQISTMMRWYVRGALTAALIGFFQLACAITHLPFPTAVLYTNTSHSIYHAYQIDGMWRLNSTFTEASDMAGSLVPALAMLCWDWASKVHEWKRTISLAVLFTSILMTLSTTGYLCIAILLVCATPVWFWQFVVRRRPDATRILIISLGVIGCCTIFATSSLVRQSAEHLIDSVVLEKADTASYKARMHSHVDALETLETTNYLGAGWGSTRASGLFYTLLAAVGIPGTVLFILSCAGILFPIVIGARSTIPHISAGCTSIAIVMILMPMSIAGAEPIAPALWIFFGAALRVTRMQRRFPERNLLRPGYSPASSASVLPVVSR